MEHSEMNKQEGGRRHRKTRSRRHAKKTHRGGKSKRRHVKKSHKQRKTMRRH